MDKEPLNSPFETARHCLERVATEYGEVSLWRVRNGAAAADHELICNGAFLMASYCRASSEALIAAALARLPTETADADVLLGGLGMGYTLKAALANSRVRSVTVVELLAPVTDWNRTHLGNGAALDDPRVTLIQGDFLDYLQSGQKQFDCLASDIDNGPSWVVLPNNEALYVDPFLGHLTARLRPGGVAAFWSHSPESEFAESLRAHLEEVRVCPVLDAGRNGRSIEAFLILGRRPLTERRV